MYYSERSLMADGTPNTVADVPVAVSAAIPFWRAPWEFAVHGIVGTLIFAIIAAFAVAVELGVGWLEAHRISLRLAGLCPHYFSGGE
jgi:hypothetical protein